MDKPHKKLDVWYAAMELASDIYDITSAFPAEERFGLVTQLRRAAVSIPSNIAEGAARSSNKEYARFLSIARGSLSELDTQLDICVKIGIIAAHARDRIDRLLDRVDKMLYGLHRAKTLKSRERD